MNIGRASSLNQIIASQITDIVGTTLNITIIAYKNLCTVFTSPASVPTKRASKNANVKLSAMCQTLFNALYKNFLSEKDFTISLAVTLGDGRIISVPILFASILHSSNKISNVITG